MKFWTKTLAVAIVAIMICSLFSFVSFAADNGDFDTWDGTADATWFDENTKEYQIDTAEKLAGLAELSTSNKLDGYSFFVTKNMDLGGHEWKAIGPSYEKTFNGYIEGRLNGLEGEPVTVKNMTVSAAPNANYGFIGTQSAGGIKNFTFVDCSLTSDHNTVGIAVGYVRKTASVYENLIVVNSTVNCKGAQYVGGVIGYEKSTNTDITFKNLAFVGGSILSNGIYTGGVIGCAHNTPANFENLYCSATVDSSAQYVGGIVGGVLDAQTRTFKNCQFDGIVYGLLELEVGAMIGNTITGDGIKLSFENCVNTGVTRASCFEPIERDSSWVGAISGNGAIEFTVTNCYDNSPATYMVGQNNSTNANCSTYKPTPVTFKQISNEVDALVNMTGLDFMNVWEARENKTPVLSLVKDYEAGKYSAADLSWFDADATKEYAIENENQLLGLAMLSYVYSPDEYTFKVADSIKGMMTEEIFDEEFLSSFEENSGTTETSATPETTPAPETSATPETTPATPATTAKPDNTTAKPDNTTAKPNTTTAPSTNENKGGGCGGFTVAASFLAIICAAGAAIVIKKK